MDGLRSLLCVVAILATVACSLMLFRGYRQERVRVLKWSAIFFGFLTLNNVALLVDVMVSPRVDLRLVRLIPTAIGTACLVYGFTSDYGRRNEPRNRNEDLRTRARSI
jgi:hypothetical protein